MISCTNTHFAQAAWYYRAAYHTRHIVGLGYHQYLVGDTVVQLRPDFFEKGGRKLSFAEAELSLRI